MHVTGMFIYSACIAPPSIVLLTRVTLRYCDRFPRGIVLMQAALLVCTATAGSFAADLIFLAVGICTPARFWLLFSTDLPFSLLFTLVFGLSMAAHETLRGRYQSAQLELRTRQVEQERAYKLLAEARLSSLESRIHPHFLFNTLNSIAALIPTDPARAEDTVGKLASLLRFSLNANQMGLTTLGQELKIVRDYLEIERTRFGERLRYVIDVPEELTGAQLPPLAVQTLVENAIKHVAANTPQGASILVRGRRASSSIAITVLDDGPGFSLDAITPEHGLGNLIARLDLLFGSAGRLEVAREGAKTAVRITIPA
jgi:LytS/YehU family sensor histidine kinase